MMDKKKNEKKECVKKYKKSDYDYWCKYTFWL